jgi:hypothetical protein
LRDNIEGDNITAIGFQSLMFNVDGNRNTGLGVNSLLNNTSGSFNSAMGWQAGTANITGSNNTFIGYMANANSGSRTNANAIGTRAYAGCSNCMILGSVDGENGATETVRVGIGTINPLYRLQVGTIGDGSEARANAWNTFSDQRFKTNIEEIPGALDKIDNLHGYYYHWNNGKDPSRQAGLMAQEVEKVLPEIVSTDSEGYKSVDYGKMNALLLQAIKEQQKQIEELQQKVEKLQK